MIVPARLAAAAARALDDPDQVRWSAVELLDALDDAVHALLLLRPDAGAVAVPHHLSPGTEQALPADGLFLFDIPASLGADGASPGPAPRLIERAALDAAHPGWPADPPALRPRHWLYDPRLPRRFEVWPPQPAQPGWVRLAQARLPPAAAAGAARIDLAAAYASPLLDHMLWRLFHRSSDATERDRARAHLDAFRRALVIGPEQAAALDPNREIAPA